jgi:hypothetical protein
LVHVTTKTARKPAAEPGDAVLLVETGDGLRRVRLLSYLTAELSETAEREANRWIKMLRHAEVDGRSLRDRFTYRGDSLWWFAELYLHKGRAINAIHRTIFALEALIERERPVGLTMVSGDRVARVLTPQIARRFRISFRRPLRLGLIADAAGRLSMRARAAFYAWSARTEAVPALLARTAGQTDVCAFVHSAFWRSGREAYIGPVLSALAEKQPQGLLFVGLGPQTNYRTRRWLERLSDFRRRRSGRARPGGAVGPAPAGAHHPIAIEAFATQSAVAPSRELWRQRTANRRALVASPALRRASCIRGCDAWPVVSRELTGIAYLQFPWSGLAMDLAGAALDCIRPRVAVTYAEAGGWGRALVLEARRRKVPIAGLQHGFISRHWLNYLHERDEVEPSAGNPLDSGFPYPTRTLVYDGFAASHLVTQGHLPAESIVATGNPRLDELFERARHVAANDLAAVRQAVGARPDQHLIVLALKFRDRYGSMLHALVESVGAMPGVHLAMKPHPADPADPYQQLAAAAANVTVVDRNTSLVELMLAARLLVTVNSTAAIEAMVLGVPALALALPNYLSPFVDAGAMAGVATESEIGAALESLVFDETCRANLAQRSGQFMRRFGIGADGHASARAADAVLALAGSGADATGQEKRAGVAAGPR